MTESVQEKHPKGLSLLFATEMWERFAFYVLQTLLVLYMSSGLNYSDDSSYLLFGAYGALLYLTPVVGGYLADKFLGLQKTILYGGWLFVIGYLILAIPHHHAFYLGLSVNIVANGLFKPNVMSILGELYYGPEDQRRDSGYTIFYMGMNIGSVFPPLFLGALVSIFNWQVGFLTAAIGMVISMIIFLTGRSSLRDKGGVPPESIFHNPSLRKRFLIIFNVAVVLSIIVINVLLRYAKEVDYFVIIVSILFLFVVLYYLFKEEGRDRLRMGAALLLTVISGAFWTFYVQGSTSVVLFAKRNMAKSILGIKLDPEAVLFFNPFFIILLSPFISKLWIILSRKGKNWSTPIKFAWGTFFMAFGYLILGLGVSHFANASLVSPWWVVFSFAFQSLGELLLSPVGLAMITALSPHEHVGLMMGVWFLMQAAAFAVGGKLATFATVLPRFSAEESLSIYGKAFMLFFWLCFSLALVSFVLVPLLNRMIHPRSNGTTPST